MTKQEFIDQYHAKQTGSVEGEAESVWNYIHDVCKGANNSDNIDDLIIVK